jgi:hypothetical protein
MRKVDIVTLQTVNVQGLRNVGRDRHTQRNDGVLPDGQPLFLSNEPRQLCSRQ